MLQWVKRVWLGSCLCGKFFSQWGEEEAQGDAGIDATIYMVWSRKRQLWDDTCGYTIGLVCF